MMTVHQAATELNSTHEGMQDEFPSGSLLLSELMGGLSSELWQVQNSPLSVIISQKFRLIEFECVSEIGGSSRLMR